MNEVSSYDLERMRDNLERQLNDLRYDLEAALRRLEDDVARRLDSLQSSIRELQEIP